MNENAVRFRDIWEDRNRASVGWLRERQTHALEAFSGQGFPKSREEGWRYTDLRQVVELYPSWLANRGADSGRRAAADFEIDGAIRIRFIDGIFRPELSDPLPHGVVAGSIAELARTDGDRLREAWGRLADDQDSGFISLNSAFADAGILIALPAGTELERPLHLDFCGSIDHISNQPRTFIDLGEGAAATVIEHYSGGAAQIVNAVTEIQCGPASRLRYYKLQEAHTSSWHLASQYISAAAQAAVTTAHIDLGAELSRNDLHILLAGPDASADSKGVFMADHKRHVESRISVIHGAPNTRSRERFRGILTDHAKGVFNGRILVEQCAQKTEAELTNRNLLLSTGAEINTKPELEIYADDVRCAHGSTTGQLDESALFYLLTRGVPPAAARDMLVIGFAAELVDALGIDALSERVRNALTKLGAMA